MIDPFIIFLVSLVALIVFASFFNILVHELGHALPILVMTKGKTSIYIGSHGDRKSCIKIPIGRLEIWLKYNPLMWFKGGLCVPPKDELLSSNKRLFYISAGPLANILLCVVCCYLLWSLNNKEYLYIFVIWVFLFFSSVSAISSLRPGKLSKYSTSGQPLYTDGYNILLLVKERKLPPDYNRAIKFLENKKYSEAAALLDPLISKGHKNLYVYRVAVAANLLGKNYSRAGEICEILFEKDTFDADDYCNAGVIDSKTNKHENALKKYQKSLDLNPNHLYSLNNLGYTLSLFERYDEAITHLDKAISLDPDFADAYNNRGYAKMKTGKMEEGLQDINYSLKLNDQNAYAYANLGVYHYLKNELDEAESLFKKAKEMDEETTFLDTYLNNIQQRKKNNSPEDAPGSASNNL